MVNVHSKALNKSIQIDRIIGHVKGIAPGPTLIFMAGIHGNEPAGIYSLCSVLDQLQPCDLKGQIFAIAGNLSALEKGIRYHHEDLNRVWTKERILKLPLMSSKDQPELTEQTEINALIQKILNEESGPFYFFDIHTTSGDTAPFLTVNDSLLNRSFTKQYPLPIILGIEEYLDGPILSYINELGYVAFGFEAGQHDDIKAIENSIAFIYLSLAFTNALDKNKFSFEKFYKTLSHRSTEKKIYEILSRYLIGSNEHFTMMPGFENFQTITKNQAIATSNGKTIKAPKKGRIFMPLYQSQGSDGFFTIKRIWNPVLKLSSLFRRKQMDRLLVLLPGIQWIDQNRSGLLVDKLVARILAKEIFHLLGYRSIVHSDQYYKMYNRDSQARFDMYKNEKWY